MKSFLWFVSLSLVLAAMTGFVFLTDADLFDLFNGSRYNQRSRWKRSQLYPQYVLPPDQDRHHFYPEEDEDRHHQAEQHHAKVNDDDNSLNSRIPSPDKFEEFWSNENYAQLMSRPTPFPPNHFINQPYFEVKPSKTVAQQSMATYKRPITSSNHKVSREVQHNGGESATKRTPFANNLSAATAVAAAIQEQNFNDLDVVLKESESKNKPSFTQMFQTAISQRRIGKPKKSIKEQIEKKKLKKEIPQQRDYRHGGGGYGHGPSYHQQQPPVYYIPNHHHKEKDFSGLLKLFLLAILIPLGICIALAVAAAFVTGLSTYGRYLVTYVNATNSTYYFINGLGGFANLFGGFGGISGLIGGASSASAATVAVAQQQQQQQSSSNNNNNNNVNNDNNNNNAVAVIVVNITGRANKDNDYFRKSFKFKSTPLQRREGEEQSETATTVENF